MFLFNSKSCLIMITNFNLFEHLSLPTLVSDSNGKIIFINKNTSALFHEINIRLLDYKYE